MRHSIGPYFRILGVITMRTKIAIALLTIFCFAELKPLLPYVDYFVNYEYISKVLCINKDEPIPTCNGTCYLSQQLKETRETENKDNGIPVVEQERIPIIFYEYDYLNGIALYSTSKKTYNYYEFLIKELGNPPPTPPPKC